VRIGCSGDLGQSPKTSYAFRVRVPAVMDSGALGLWVLAMLLAAGFTWWDWQDAEPPPPPPPSPPDAGIFWMDVEDVEQMMGLADAGPR